MQSNSHQLFIYHLQHICIGTVSYMVLKALLLIVLCVFYPKLLPSASTPPHSFLYLPHLLAFQTLMAEKP